MNFINQEFQQVQVEEKKEDVPAYREVEDNIASDEEKFQLPEFVDEEADEDNIEGADEPDEDNIDIEGADELEEGEGADELEEGEGADEDVPLPVAVAVPASVAVPLPIPEFKLPLNVITALTACGQINNYMTAIELAVTSFTVEAVQKREMYQVIKMFDPVSGKLLKFKLNPQSIKDYNKKTADGLVALAKGQKLIEDGRKLQRAGVEDLAKYGTVICCADICEETNKRKREDDIQRAIEEENLAHAEMAIIEARQADERAIQRAKIAKAKSPKK